MQGKTKKDNMNISKNKEKLKKLEEIVIMLLIEEVAEEEEEDNLLKLNKLQKKNHRLLQQKLFAVKMRFYAEEKFPLMAAKKLIHA